MRPAVASPHVGRRFSPCHWTAESKWAFSVVWCCLVLLGVVNASRAENRAGCKCNVTGNQRYGLLCVECNNYKLTCGSCSTGKAKGALIDVSDNPVKSKLLI